VLAMRPDTLTKRRSAGPERPGNPGRWARIGNEGFVRALRPEEVTKRVRAALRAEGNEGPGVNRLPAAVVPDGPSSSVSRLNITRSLSTAGARPWITQRYVLRPRPWCMALARKGIRGPQARPWWGLRS